MGLGHMAHIRYGLLIRFEPGRTSGVLRLSLRTWRGFISSLVSTELLVQQIVYSFPPILTMEAFAGRPEYNTREPMTTEVPRAAQSHVSVWDTSFPKMDPLSNDAQYNPSICTEPFIFSSLYRHIDFLNAAAFNTKSTTMWNILSPFFTWPCTHKVSRITIHYTTVLGRCTQKARTLFEAGLSFVWCCLQWPDRAIAFRTYSQMVGWNAS
jgi:hypothetical protein